MNYRELTMEEAKFLYNYEPKDFGITSKEEAMDIYKSLSLADYDSLGLTATRNSVVRFYGDLQNREISRTSKPADWMPSIQSVTAVIDECIYNPSYFRD